MRASLLSIVLIGALATSVALTGCGGSSGGGGSAAGGNGGKHAITASECQSIQSVFDDLQSFAAGLGGLDYVKHAATVDKVGSTVEFPDSVSDSYEKWQDAIDKIAATMNDVGVKPNDTPLPDQMDELNSKFSSSDSLNKAGGTVSTWVGNGCD